MKTFIVTPVGNNCNIRCDYCYHSNLMKPSLVEPDREAICKFIDESISIFDRVRYIWHGGEPLLAGLDFYREVVDVQKKCKKRGQVVINGIQTNATLIDEEWGKFFAANNFYVSTSLDGTKELHNLHRGGSYDNVLKGMKYLNKYLKRVGIIVVVNKDNVLFPDELYNSLCLDDRFGGFELHPCMPVAVGDNKLVPEEKDLLNFMCRIFDLWWAQDNPRIHIRSFEDIIRVFLGVYPTTCVSQRKGCLHLGSMDYDGSIYTCSRFMKENEGYLGNILNNSLYDILKSEETERIYQQMVELPKECESCEWIKYCGGGCAYQRWLNEWSKYYQCYSRRGLFAHIVSTLQK